MKKTILFIKTLLFLGVIILTSCKGDITELDLTENPNFYNEADADFLLNKVQIDFAKMFEKFQKTAGETTRLYYMNGRDYSNAYSPSRFDARWQNAYAEILTDIKEMKKTTSEKGLIHHEAISQIIEAYTLTTLVDFFGDIPYTETLQGADNFNPMIDDGASVYQAAFNLLDDAINKFESDVSAEPKNDFYYNKDWAKWIKLANTLKMQMYVNTRLVDSNAINEFNAIVTDGNYITDYADDFQFQWGSNVSQPDTRHPRYTDNYTSTGGEEYMSNSLMDYMTGLDDGAYSSPNHFDPRTLFYFYRQVSATPGFGGEPVSEEVLECGILPDPPHYAGYTYCGIPKGWWGRDHGNDNGIPPDNFLRTLAGVYPTGGKLDDLSYTAQSNTTLENGGNGITPLMLASWAKFMIAEVNMANNNPGDAKTALLEGMDLSWNKVNNFAPKTDRFNIIFDGVNNLPTIQSYYDDFKNEIETDWDTGDMNSKWNILSNQYFVASYGNGMNTYNYYRRTGFPTNLQPNLDPNPGSFIRSFYYPANFVNNNANATQKSGVNVKVFWDNNPESPAFPQSN
ncbi:MAG TPA: SusD/RagB family nutrient-binding outer membrane lipoprotein [Crocinitomix sp.]|nr:SusD/RagB family nutrient-binding outer membrane lipoprotein [Crocinitomix sp.]